MREQKVYPRQASFFLVLAGVQFSSTLTRATSVVLLPLHDLWLRGKTLREAHFFLHPRWLGGRLRHYRRWLCGWAPFSLAMLATAAAALRPLAL